MHNFSEKSVTLYIFSIAFFNHKLCMNITSLKSNSASSYFVTQNIKVMHFHK